MPSRVSGAPFWVPSRLEARFRYPAAASSDAGAGMAGWSSHRAGSCMVRPEVAAARNRQVSRVCAAGPHSSRRPGSSTVKTKWLGGRGGRLDIGDLGEEINPETLRLAADTARIEQVHRALLGADRCGGGPQVRFVGRG